MVPSPTPSPHITKFAPVARSALARPTPQRRSYRTISLAIADAVSFSPSEDRRATASPRRPLPWGRPGCVLQAFGETRHPEAPSFFEGRDFHMVASLREPSFHGEALFRHEPAGLRLRHLHVSDASTHLCRQQGDHFGHGLLVARNPHGLPYGLLAVAVDIALFR